MARTMSNQTVKRYFEDYGGIRYFVQKSFDPDWIQDPYLRDVILKARAYYLEGEKRVQKYLIPPKKGATHP